MNSWTPSPHICFGSVGSRWRNSGSYLTRQEGATPARAELDLLFGTTSAGRLAPLSSDGFMEVRPGVGVFLQRIRHVFAESCVITFDYGDGWQARRRISGRVVRW